MASLSILRVIDMQRRFMVAVSLSEVMFFLQAYCGTTDLVRECHFVGQCKVLLLMAAAAASESAPTCSSSRRGSTVDGGLHPSFLVESPVDKGCRDIWNYMLYALPQLTPDLETDIKMIVVECDDKVKDFHTFPTDALRVFADAISEEFPVGKKLLGKVLDVTVNYQKWKTTPYLYAYLVGNDRYLGSQHSVSFGVTMEMLLFTCVTKACEDVNLQNNCREVFGVTTCSCVLAWQLHKYDLNMDGFVVKKLGGAGGRIAYHIVAACDKGNDVKYYDIGHVYHTTNWRQNTFHVDSPLPPSTRALVVCSNSTLAESFRNAILSSWLRLSGNGVDRSCCLLKRCQLPLQDNCCHLPADATAVCQQQSQWVFPPVEAATAAAQSKYIMKHIIFQCQLVCPSSSSRNAKDEMLQGLLFRWDPENGLYPPCNHEIAQEVYSWLQRLRESLSAEHIG